MNFAVFIISHERSDRVETYDILRRTGYTGTIHVVVDDEDSQLQQYKNRFGEELDVFNKQKYRESVDTITNDKRLSTAVYARQYVEDTSRDSGLDAYIIMDDDVTGLRYRYLQDYVVKSQRLTQNLDKVFEAYIEYLLEGNIATLSFANVMIYAGGVKNEADIRRLASHRFTTCIHIRNMKFPVEWKSLTNEDSISGGLTAKIGYLWWTLPFVAYETPPVGQSDGGMKSIYDLFSPFKRSFLSTVALPATNRVGTNKDKFNIRRDIKSAYPMIVSSRYKR